MPLFRELLLLGVSHKTAAVEIRERCAVRKDGVVPTLKQLKDEHGLTECWLLSTCNRTEIVAVGDGTTQIVERLRATLFGMQIPDDAVYAHRGVEAVFHMFRVAGGLDSQVLGESQILAQIKDAAAAAKEAGTLGPIVHSLIEHALTAGKRVRSETKVGEGTLSVAKAAVELAQKVLGSFARAKCLIVGAGETGLLVARHLRDGGCRDLVFTNRTFARAEAAAAEFGGTARPLESLGEYLSDMDLTIVSVDGSEPIVRTEHVDPARLRKHDRPPVLIDISIPRAIDPVLRSVDDLLVHDLDDLESIVSRHRREREAEVERAGHILVEETHKWFGLRTYAALKPVITGLVERFEGIRRDFLTQQGKSGPEWEHFSEKLMRRLLDEALGSLKEGARKTLSEDILERHYREWLTRS